jgi:lysophospholipase L1-like esterase
MTAPQAPHRETETVVCIGSRLETTPQPGSPGEHWAQFLHALLAASHPGKRYRFIDQCAVGQRLLHLRERWADDVLWYNPDTVVVMIGIADVYYNLQDHPDRMLESEWGDCLRRIVAMHREERPDTRFVFIEPFLHTLGCIPEAEELRKYREQMCIVCKETGCAFVPVADAMQKRVASQGEFSLGTSLNPNIEAQLLIADAALQAVAPEAVRACPPVDDDLLLCIGDSITDVGRREPQKAPLGFGYVRFASALWQARTGRAQHIRNEGIAGNTIGDLKARWQRDVLVHKPKRMTVKVGINDANRHLSKSPGGMSPQVYRETYDQLLGNVLEARPECEFFLIQPFFLSRMTDPQSYRTRVLQALKDYHVVVRDVAGKYGGKVLETHEMFQRHLDLYHQNELSHEPVHINLLGHTILAEAFLNLLGQGRSSE